MDEMNLKLSVTTSIISKILKKEIKKKTGIDSDIQLTNLQARNDGKLTDVSIQFSIPTSDIPKLVSKVIGL